MVRPLLTDRPTSLDLGRPRTVAEILATAFWLFGRFPLQFISLALVLVVPYDIVVLIVAKASPLGQQRASTETVLILALTAVALVQPLVSALQVQALVAIAGNEPSPLRSALSRSLPVLPVVVAAEIIAWIGIGIGFVLFIIPGVILLLRWTVVAQVAAAEGVDWPTALRRSAQLASRNYLRIFGLRVVVALVIATLTNLVAAGVGTSHHPAEVAVGIVVDVLTTTFQALVISVLYFDLRAREKA